MTTGFHNHKISSSQRSKMAAITKNSKNCQIDTDSFLKPKYYDTYNFNEFNA